MEFNASLFLTALGLACVLESLPWLLGPGSMRKAVRQLLEFPAEKLRLWGVFLLAAGLVIIWLAR